ncbi:irregular chiasm C-roughest protein-like isoform X2 [Hyposmocoma kahamanoa]|uniref:irregular chiasm C-roughest protein-like isoform X2 n=1 Tax=Hyposmocoma kahamanoa TaxID=1477025 RepID=UPI000E6D5D0D|nr:irregular chiasm C-roughest protein-like isoform X2 [Hyposmocoma kahamanoa]
MATKFKEELENQAPFINSTILRPSGFNFEEFKIRTWTGKRKWMRRPDVGVWFLPFTFLLIGCHGYQEQRFAMEPQDQSAIVGSRVTLPCRVENKVGTLQWTKDDFGLGTHRNLSGYERYTMIGSDDEGDYSLDIRNITLEDDGVYQCQVSSGLNGEPPIRSRYAHLTVLVAPDPPRIVQGAFIDATEEQPIVIECVSSGGKPAAEITWVDGNQAVIKKKNIQNNVETLRDGHRTTTRSTLRLTPTKEHHNKTITCQAQNTADRAYRMATVHIEVKYAPKVSIKLKSDEERVKEGTEARFLCSVDANPAPLIYRWYINDSPVLGDYVEEMIIFNVSRKYHEAEIKCEVSNTVGKNDSSLKLEVSYPPSFRTRPRNKEADFGKKVTLSCDVDGQPTPEITWLYHEPGRIDVKGEAANLVINVTNDTAGRYICKATVPGYPPIQDEVTVFLKAKPEIISNRTQFGPEGERVTVECIAISIPKPDDITWYFEGRQINAFENPIYAILNEPLEDGLINVSLVIKTSQSKHFGSYNCSVTNKYGNANVAIVLKPLKTLPLFIILIGVTAGIILFSIFIASVVVCYRRRRKMQQLSEKPDVTVTTGDMYKESDRSSNISDLKLQLPQSDGTYELDYTSSDRSDTKVPVGLPLAGPVPLPNIRLDDPLLQFRYSNDYSDPSYADSYFKNPGGFVYDYPQGYAPPPHLRVQSPTHLEVPPANRSLQGSLTRSIDTTSTLPLSGGSQNNSLQRINKSADETDAINNLGLPVGGETPPTPIYAQPNSKNSGVDLRYAATYGNPYLKNSSLGYGNQVHTAKPASTPAPPPYSAVRSSVVIPQGNGNQPAQATHV